MVFLHFQWYNKASGARPRRVMAQDSRFFREVSVRSEETGNRSGRYLNVGDVLLCLPEGWVLSMPC